MRRYIPHFLLLLFVAFFPLISAGQGFYLRTIDLKVKSFELASIQSITFNNNNLLIRKTAGSTETYPIPSISALYFSSLYTASPTISSVNTGRIAVYPSPAGSTLHIANIPQRESQVFIFGTDGRILIRTTVTQDNPEISLSGLTRGVYILKVDNQAVKFIRQ